MDRMDGGCCFAAAELLGTAIAEQPERPPGTAAIVCSITRVWSDKSRHNPLDNKECGEAKDRKPPGVGYHDVIPVWQSFILGNLEKELYETFEQRRAKVVDVLSSADAVSVLRPEEDVAELLWMGNAELNQAA